jgi:putative ABC transport system substrate-binding protein
LELLKEASPRTTRVALLFVPGIVVENYFAAIHAAADFLGIEVIQAPYRSDTELEQALDDFAGKPNGALVLVPPPPRGSNRALINKLALGHITANKHDARDGVMMSYGADAIEPTRIAASYIDRILRGAKIMELPVQFPTKIELVINLKTAAAIGLTVPESLLFRADEVIE